MNRNTNIPALHIENNIPAFMKSFSIPNFNERALKNKISVYPNPTNGLIYLNSSIQREFKYSIFDIAGNEIVKPTKVMPLYNSSIQLNIESKPSGMYYIHIETDHETEFIPIIKI